MTDRDDQSACVDGTRILASLAEQSLLWMRSHGLLLS